MVAFRERRINSIITALHGVIAVGRNAQVRICWHNEGVLWFRPDQTFLIGVQVTTIEVVCRRKDRVLAIGLGSKREKLGQGCVRGDAYAGYRKLTRKLRDQNRIRRISCRISHVEGYQFREEGCKEQRVFGDGDVPNDARLNRTADQKDAIGLILIGELTGRIKAGIHRRSEAIVPNLVIVRPLLVRFAGIDFLVSVFIESRLQDVLTRFARGFRAR